MDSTLHGRSYEQRVYVEEEQGGKQRSAYPQWQRYQQQRQRHR